MKRILPTLAALVLATASQADLSDRERDLRLDTAKPVQSETGAAATTKAEHPRVTRLGRAAYSTRSATPGQGYAYANPYGVGPNNDSR